MAKIDTNRISFLNTYIDSLTASQAKSIIKSFVEDGEQHYVVTPNSDIIVKMQEDPELKTACESADLILTDGEILVKISRLLKNPIVERVCMTDFVWDVLDLACDNGYKVFLFGGKENVLKKATRAIKGKYPDLKIVGSYSPPFNFETDREQVKAANERIQKSGADILLVFLGCPKQEKFIVNNMKQYRVPVSIPMGGCADFIAGSVKRAPKWMQKAGMEWLFRFSQEPKRLFRRYFIDDVKIFGLIFSHGVKKKALPVTESESETPVHLCMITKDLTLNGISSVVSAYCDQLPQDKYEITILTGEEISKKYIDKYSNTHVRIVRCPSKNADKIGYYRAIYHYLKTHATDIVHIHGSSSICAVELMMAKLCGIHKRVMHVHSTSCDHVILHRLLRPLLNSLCTDRCACGRNAGLWLYHKRPFTVIPNGFDTEHFRFDPMKRKRIRDKLNLTDEVIICHIGYFGYTKNHPYLIKIYDAYAEKNSASRLLLVGNSDGIDQIRKLAAQSAHGENIIFYGESQDTSEIYSAADIFVLPSHFEGLPMVLLEAQISGLPCLVSDRVTNEVSLGGDIQWLSIQVDPALWAEKIHVQSGEKRMKFVEEHPDAVADYEIRNTVNMLEGIYNR